MSTLFDVVAGLTTTTLFTWLEFSKSMSRTCELSRAVEEEEGGVEELAWKLTVELVDWKLEQR